MAEDELSAYSVPQVLPYFVLDEWIKGSSMQQIGCLLCLFNRIPQNSGINEIESLFLT
jgi:hypothetical protein